MKNNQIDIAGFFSGFFHKIFFYFMVAFFGLITINASAQINVGHSASPTISSGGLKDTEIQKLRGKEVIFVCRDEDDPASLQKILDKVWTLGKLKVVPYSELTTVNPRGKGIFIINGYCTKFVNSGNTLQGSTNVYLRFYFMDKSTRIDFAKIDLNVTEETVQLMQDSYLEPIPFFYKEHQFDNWSYAMLKIYVKIINDHLEKGQKRWVYKSHTDKDKIQALKNSKLLVVDSNVPQEMLKNYPYKTKTVSIEELDKIVLNAKDDVYILSYVQAGGEKFINVFNALTCELIYSNYTAASLELKEKDIIKLSKTVKKNSK